MTLSLTGLIGRDLFSYLHDFHWTDHRWSQPIPIVAELETYEFIVSEEHPELFNTRANNVESEQ